jgi:hypothetical protein
VPRFLAGDSGARPLLCVVRAGAEREVAQYLDWNVFLVVLIRDNKNTSKPVIAVYESQLNLADCEEIQTYRRQRKNGLATKILCARRRSEERESSGCITAHWDDYVSPW